MSTAPAPPTPGKIGYLIMPATDIEQSAAFYGAVFGWTIRRRSDGAVAFHDPNGSVSGSWVLGRPSATPGFLLYIMVENVAATVEAIVAAGGEIAAPVGVDPGEISAWFRDPAGNVLGIAEDR